MCWIWELSHMDVNQPFMLANLHLALKLMVVLTCMCVCVSTHGFIASTLQWLPVFAPQVQELAEEACALPASKYACWSACIIHEQVKREGAMAKSRGGSKCACWQSMLSSWPRCEVACYAMSSSLPVSLAMLHAIPLELHCCCLPARLQDSEWDSHQVPDQAAVASSSQTTPQKSKQQKTLATERECLCKSSCWLGAALHAACLDAKHKHAWVLHPWKHTKRKNQNNKNFGRREEVLVQELSVLVRGCTCMLAWVLACARAAVRGWAWSMLGFLPKHPWENTPKEKIKTTKTLAEERKCLARTSVQRPQLHVMALAEAQVTCLKSTKKQQTSLEKRCACARAFLDLWRLEPKDGCKAETRMVAGWSLHWEIAAGFVGWKIALQLYLTASLRNAREDGLFGN